MAVFEALADGRGLRFVGGEVNEDVDRLPEAVAPNGYGQGFGLLSGARARGVNLSLLAKRCLQLMRAELRAYLEHDRAA
ncbi:MAG: hypothetical protein U9R79_07650 [Armatimonadota bacterium]|nr:hypothetical protein [Armatimonadota bacterium]